MLCESTLGRVDLGMRAKVYTWQNVFPGRRVTLPSKMSFPAGRVALLVSADPSLCFARKRFDVFCQNWLAQVSSGRRGTLPPGTTSPPYKRGLSLKC